MPGTWVLAGSYASRASAVSTALRVRTGERVPFYRPAGAYEARTELTQGGADLWIRYAAGQPADRVAADFRASVEAGLTEDLDAFSRRLDAAATDTARRT